MKNKKNNNHQTGIPISIVHSVAKTLLPSIFAFYESKEGQEYFEKWKAEQEKKNKE